MWELVWRYDLSRILCRYLLSNGSCGKSRNLTRQKLIHWFRTEGVELVETWASIRTPVVDLVEGCKKVGQIKVVGATPRKERQ